MLGSISLPYFRCGLISSREWEKMSAIYYTFQAFSNGTTANTPLKYMTYSIFCIMESRTTRTVKSSKILKSSLICRLNFWIPSNLTQCQGRILWERVANKFYSDRSELWRLTRQSGKRRAKSSSWNKPSNILKIKKSRLIWCVILMIQIIPIYFDFLQ